jgi:TP901 family phage tail tape measure protein
VKVGELFAELKLDTSSYDTSLSTAETKGGGFLDRFGGKAGLVIGGAVAGAGLAVGSFVTGSLSSFGEFETGMNEVFTLMPGITDEAMGDMTGQVKDFAKEMGVLPEEVVPALYQAISAGVPPGNVFEFLETSQKAAEGGVTDLTTAVDGISSVVNAYGDNISGATEASDLMFTAVKLGKTDMEQLSGSLFNVVPTAAALGVGFGDVTAAIAAMTAQGTPTSVATTQMRQAFVELSKDGGVTADLFKDLTGKTFKQFIDGGGNTADALDILAEHAADSGVGINDLFGSVEAGAAALALTGTGAETFRNNLAEMDASAGATQTAYDRMGEGGARSFAKFGASMAVLKLQVGSILLPPLLMIVDFVTNKLLPTLVKIPQIVDQNKPVFIAMAGAILAVLVPAFITWAATAGAAAAATLIALAPVVGPILLIAAAAAALGFAWQENFLGIRDITDEVIGFVKPLIEGAMEAIRVVVEEVVGLVKDLLDGDWTAAWERASGWVTSAQEAIEGALPLIWDAIKGFITETIPKLASELLTMGVEFVTWIAPQIPPLLLELGKFLLAIYTWILTVAIPGVVTKLASMAWEFIAWIGPQIPGLLLELGKFLLAMTNWIITEALPGITGKLAEWGAAFIGWIAKDALPFIVTELWTLYTKMVNWITDDALPSLGTKLAQWGKAFVGWVAKDAVPFIVTELLKLQTKISNWIVDDAVPALLTKAAELGDALVTGIWDGINGATDWLVGKLTQWVEDAIPGPVRKALELFSPSRVMAQIGTQIPAGLAVGIEGNIGTVRDAMRQMSQLAMQGMQLPSPVMSAPAAAGGGHMGRELAPLVAALGGLQAGGARTVVAHLPSPIRPEEMRTFVIDTISGRMEEIY